MAQCTLAAVEAEGEVRIAVVEQATAEVALPEAAGEATTRRQAQQDHTGTAYGHQPAPASQLPRPRQHRHRQRMELGRIKRTRAYIASWF